METHFYDVVVCGGELGGLVTAALLSRRGLRVLVVGLDQVPAVLNVAGRSLPAEPGLLPPLDSDAVARVFTEMNHLPIVRRRCTPFVPPLTLAVGEHRLRLLSDAGQFFTEARRVFPDAHPQLEAIFSRLTSVGSALDSLLGSQVALPPLGFWERREIARTRTHLPPPTADLLAPLAADHPLRGGLAGLAALTGRLDPGDVGPVPLARAFELGRRGFGQVAGGLLGLRALFLDRIAAASGEVRPSAGVVELITKRGRPTGLRLFPRDEVVGLKHLVWAAPANQLIALCDERQGQRLRELSAALRPTCYRYRLACVARAETVPHGLGTRIVAVHDPQRPLFEENALLITVGQPDPRAPDPTSVVIWIECLVPIQTVDAERTYLGVVRKRVLEQAGTLLPRLATDQTLCASVHDGLPPLSLARPAPAPPMWPMPTQFSPDLPRVLEVGGTPRDIGLSHVHLAGAEVLPGLGLEGDFVTGWSVARAIRPEAPPRAFGRGATIVGDP